MASAWRGYRSEHEVILDRHSPPEALMAEHSKERQAMVETLQASNAHETAAPNAKKRSLIGRFRTALATAREAREPGSGRLQLVRLTIGFGLSPAAARDRLAANWQWLRQISGLGGTGQALR
jgi:hypothetical protein